MAYVRPLGVYTEIGRLDWQANTTKTMLLNRENEVQLYKLRLELTHDNGANASLSVTDLFRAVREIRVVAGGRNNIKMVGAIKMYLNYLKNYGIVPRYQIDSTASKTGAKSWVIIEVPFNMFDMMRPIDSILPSYRFQNLDLKVTFDSATAVGTDVTITDGSVTVFEDAIENLNRDFNYGFYKEIFQSKKISASNPKEELRLPTEMLYKQFAFISYVDGALSDDVIKGVTIKSGSKIIKQYSVTEIKEQMRRRSHNTDEALLKGMLIVDFAERGHGTEFIDTRASAGGFKQLSIELDVVAVGTDNQIDAFSDYYEEIPLKA